jgi:hypothetical protein
LTFAPAKDVDADLRRHDRKRGRSVGFNGGSYQYLAAEPHAPAGGPGITIDTRSLSASFSLARR